MVDERFYELLPSQPLVELAKIGNAELSKASNSTISGVASFNSSKFGDLTFIETLPADIDGSFCAAACVGPVGLAALLSSDTSVFESKFPRWSFSRISSMVVRRIEPDHHDAYVHPSATIEDGAIVSAKAFVSQNAKVGRGTQIGAGVFIGPGVTIGRNCIIGPNVSIYCSLLGDNVRIQAGCVFGEDGFGLSPGPSGLLDTPHFGRVVVQDGVSIGANCSIDRGLFDDTVIGFNTKLDNNCHIAHNVKVGSNCVIAAQCGIAGSTIIGDGCMFGGAVGIKDHAKIGNNVKLGGRSGVMHDIPDGETWGGFPAKPLKKWMRETAWLAREAQKR